MKRLTEHIQGLIARRTRSRHMTRIVTAIAAILAFLTVYTLIHPALALDEKEYSEPEAYEQSNECYLNPIIEENAENSTLYLEENAFSTDGSVRKEEDDCSSERMTSQEKNFQLSEHDETELTGFRHQRKNKSTETESKIRDEEADPGADVPLLDADDNNGPVSEEESTEDYSISQKSDLSQFVDFVTSGNDSVSEETIHADPIYEDEEKQLCFEGNDFTITVIYDQSADLPDDVQLDVEEIRDHPYAISNVRFFAIRLVSGQSELEPQVPVTVLIRDDRTDMIEDETEVSVICFSENADPMTLDTELVTDPRGFKSAKFTAERLSVYGIVYTVD